MLHGFTAQTILKLWSYSNSENCLQTCVSENMFKQEAIENREAQGDPVQGPGYTVVLFSSIQATTYSLNYILHKFQAILQLIS